MGTGNHGLKRGKINRNNTVIDRIGITCQRNIVRFPALCLQECSCDLIGGENGSGCTQLCTHIGNGCALGNGQGIYTGAAPLDNRAYTTLNRQDPQNLKAHILCCDIGIQLTGQFDLVHFWHGDIVSATTHCYSHVQAARTERQHADTTAGRCMAVRANEGLTWFTKALQMNLVANTVTGTGEIHTMLIGNGLQITVIVRILKTGLKGVVIHISNTQFCLDSGDTHGLKFQISHGAGSILG